MTKVAVALIIGVLFALLTLPFLEPVQARLVGLVAFLVTLWTNEGLELGSVSMLPLILFPALGILEFDAVAPNYAKPIIFLFIGGFLLAIGMQKSALHIVIAQKVLSVFPHSGRGIIYALALTSALLSTILSNTTTTILMIPMAIFLSDDKTLKLRFVLAIAYGATIGGILTPIGTAPNMLLLQFLSDQGVQNIAFFEWVGKLFPLVALMLLFMPYLLSIGIADKQVEAPSTMPLHLNRAQKKLTWVLALLTMLLLVNSPIPPFYEGLGLDEKMLVLGAGLMLFAPGMDLLRWEDTKEVPYSIVFLFGASFTIAMAFQTSGLGTRLAEPIAFLADWPTLALLMGVAFFVSFATEVTSNTALISIALPIFFGLSQLVDMESFTVMMVATVASSYAFMLPIATPPNAIALSSGVVGVHAMARYGIVLNFAGILFLGLLSRLYW